MGYVERTGNVFEIHHRAYRRLTDHQQWTWAALGLAGAAYGITTNSWALVGCIFFAAMGVVRQIEMLDLRTAFVISNLEAEIATIKYDR